MAAMTEVQKYTIYEFLLADLQKKSADYAQKKYLEGLIDVAVKEIGREGIELDFADMSHLQTIEMYAAYLYRKRTADNNGMPRMLRFRLNNLLFEQKMESDS
jgi:hypothetical protein